VQTFTTAMSDTTADVEARMDAHYRAMSVAEKVALMASLQRTVCTLARARLRREAPDATDDEIEERLRALWWPPELHRAFFAARRVCDARTTRE
jgi:hypothetical protein